MQIHERPPGPGGIVHLALDGGLDHTNTGPFVERMDALLETGRRRVLLDLEELTYISSWGLGALVRVHHHFAVRGGRLAFARLHSKVAGVLKVSHMDRLFDLYATLEEAMAALRDEQGGPDDVAQA